MDMQPQSEYDQRINRVKQYIRANIDESLNRDLLAEIAGFSVPHFHRVFTGHVGETVSQYVRRLRMTRAARQLLNPAVHVTDVALNSGYETHSAFGKAFKQMFGISPSAFRELDRTTAIHMISQCPVYKKNNFSFSPVRIMWTIWLKLHQKHSPQIFVCCSRNYSCQHRRCDYAT